VKHRAVPVVFVAAALSVACGENFRPSEGTGGGGSTSSSGSGGSVVLAAGCADDSRELFADQQAYPEIAGCQGAWDVPGVTTMGSDLPACLRAAGNNGENTFGTGCSVQDLCAAGWHVCETAEEVATGSEGDGCPATAEDELWLTRQTTEPGALFCGTPSENNLVGCGGLGEDADPSCSPLTAVAFFSHCDGTAWRCGDMAQGDREAALVVKLNPLDPGGVLCCRD
jgi:hypothetical protein